VNKKGFLIAYLIGIVLLALALTPISSQQSAGEYDPWFDINDDGKIDIKDVAGVAVKYGSEGTPINKTALLLELQTRIDSLNASLIDLEAYLETRIADLEARIVDLEAQSVRKYDSGWFAVGRNSDYDLTHNLGTTSLIVSLWFSKTSDGSQRCYGPAPLSWREHNPEHVSGVTVAEITTTTIRIRTGNDFRIPTASPSSDGYETLSSGYVRVTVLAID